jgi:hypothetical protein
LSLWQSSARAAAHQELLDTATEVDASVLYNHPLVRAASEHARFSGSRSTDMPAPAAVAEVGGLETEQPKRMLDAGSVDAPDPVYLSSLFFELANARAEDDTVRANNLETEARKYSTADTSGWATCATNYVYYLAKQGGRVYNTWRGTRAGLQFSVIGFKLRNDAVVGVIGDWGTGQDDAVQLLKVLITGVQAQYNRPPDAIIHLGDIYYSGTPIGTSSAPNYPGECQTNFLKVLTNVFTETLGAGKRIPVFSIPGNHEYYSMGAGYFHEVLPQTNSGTANQPASFFCLRTEDDSWQFLGMDTGYHDSNPANQFNPFDPAPELQKDEVVWLHDKLDNFAGKTILLSHHQLFSANAKLNGGGTGYPPNFNTFLMSYFGRYFGTIAAWLWGHEHNMVLYQDDLLGLTKGRLIGSSAYEETTGETPYRINYQGAPYLDPTKYQLGSDGAYYNHSYAIMDFARKSPGDPISIAYYQYPSWGGVKSTPPSTSSLVYQETVDAVPDAIGAPVKYGDSLTMQLLGYGNLAPIDPDYTNQFFPIIDSLNSVVVSFAGSGGQIADGATVQIQTTEAAAGAYNILGAWTSAALYYYKGGYPQQNWTIKKTDTSTDSIIHYGDQFYLVNQSYANQWLAPLHQSGKTYLTTLENANAYWSCAPLVSGEVVNFNDNVRAQTQVGGQWMTVGPEVQSDEYYPPLVSGTGVTLQLIGGSGRIVSGSAVQIKTTESAVDVYDLLGAFGRAYCYWYKSGYPNESWQIWKKDATVDNIVRKGDLITFTNSYYSGQWLVPVLQGSTYWLSTTATVGSHYWRLT